MPLDTLNIHVPDVPGDVGLCGELREDIAAAMAKRYKSWIYVNSPDNPHFLKSTLEAAGCQVECHLFPGPPSMPSPEQADAIVKAIDRLPRPLMLQCNTGLRVGVALLLWLAKSRGYSAESAAQLGNDVSLKSFTNCMRCGPMREWLLAQLPQHNAVPVPSSLDELIFHQLFDEETWTFTYVLGCGETREAILIDPVLEQMDRDLDVLAELGLNLKYVVNTHCHADHITSGGVIKKKLPTVQTVISKASAAKADIHIVEGDKVAFGKWEIEVLATPGHTDGCLSFLCKGKPDAPAMVFTGDALLIRGCGRTDFQQGNAGTLFDSVTSKIFTLPGNTLVYPGHDYKGRNVSTVDEEKRFNGRLTAGRDGFIKIMSELNLPYPKKIDIAVPANMVCGVQD